MCQYGSLRSMSTFAVIIKESVCIHSNHCRVCQHWQRSLGTMSVFIVINVECVVIYRDHWGVRLYLQWSLGNVSVFIVILVQRCSASWSFLSFSEFKLIILEFVCLYSDLWWVCPCLQRSFWRVCVSSDHLALCPYLLWSSGYLSVLAVILGECLSIYKGNCGVCHYFQWSLEIISLFTVIV